MNSTGIESFLAFLRQVEKEYRIACETETAENNATQDILHMLELQKQSYHQRAKLATELVEVRRRRRDAKDIKIQAELIVEWINENKAVVRSLEKLLGEVRKVEKHIENRVYIPRSLQNSKGEPNE